MDEEEALATMGRRYLEGYGPADDRDLAAWSGLALGPGAARAGAGGAGRARGAGEPPACALLAAFDPAMLGWESREPLVAAHARARRPAGRRDAQAGGAGRRTGGGHVAGCPPEFAWFGPEPPAEALAAEVADVERFLAS